MRIINGMAPGVRRLAGHGSELSREARARLKWMDYYRFHGYNARLTCRHFGIAPQTFYRWRRRYDPKHLESLEDKSRRPRRLRQPTASPELVEAVREFREERPRWGKDKLAPLLREAGWRVSNSMVGRIMRRLREQGRLVQAPRARVPARRRSYPRPYAIRKPKGYEVTRPGDLIQLDTHTGPSAPAGSHPQALHSPRHGLSLGCLGGSDQGNSGHRQPLSGLPAKASALPGEGDSGGWWL